MILGLLIFVLGLTPTDSWLCLGDSITWQAGFADTACDSKWGVIGTQSVHWIAADLTGQYHGNGVRVLLGTNDAISEITVATYGSQMATVVQNILDQGHHRVQLVYPIRNTDDPNADARVQLYHPELATICASSSRIFCSDPYDTVRVEDMSGDGVHPSSAGHTRLSDKVIGDSE